MEHWHHITCEHKSQIFRKNIPADLGGIISVWVGAVLHWFLTGWGAVRCIVNYVIFVAPVWLHPLGLLNWGKIACRSHSSAISWWWCDERWPLRRCAGGVFFIIGITTTIFSDLRQDFWRWGIPDRSTGGIKAGVSFLLYTTRFTL